MMSRNGVLVLRARYLVFPPATIRSGSLSYMTDKRPVVLVSAMMDASSCMSAFMR